MKIAKQPTVRRSMDTSKSTACPKDAAGTHGSSSAVKDRERGVPGGVYISCSACEFFDKTVKKQFSVLSEKKGAAS